MKAVTKYQTTDGKEFNVEAEAAAHQSGLDNGAAIDAFLDVNYPTPTEGKAGPTRAIARKAVALWIASQSATTEGGDE